ncbi:hypothetical protein BGW37DRAFT_531596 [Umbelopsis sp. PMI_123]|nr:hypothetical protein BGW37DRAFT_531596 [Umbelopsis sp. PMI_123]
MKNTRIFLASVLALSASITVNAQMSASSEEVTTVWQTIIEYKTSADEMSATPTGSDNEIVSTASTMEPVKTGAPTEVDEDADADAQTEAGEEAEVGVDAEVDEAEPAETVKQVSPSASVEASAPAASAPAASAPAASAPAASVPVASVPAASASADEDDEAPASTKTAASAAEEASANLEDDEKPLTSAVPTGAGAPAATPSGSMATEPVEEVVPGFPAALLPNANGDIEGLPSESSMAAPFEGSAFPSLTSFATGHSTSASASGMRPSISLKQMSASAAGSSPTGQANSAASKVGFAGVSIAAMAFAGLLLLL